MDKTITFTMEDALLSPISLAILTKAKFKTMTAKDYIHATAKISKSVADTQEKDSWKYSSGIITIKVDETSELGKNLKEIVGYTEDASATTTENTAVFVQTLTATEQDDTAKMVYCSEVTYTPPTSSATVGTLALEIYSAETDNFDTNSGDTLFIDFYKNGIAETENMVMTIEPETFEGNFYLEASTLFRNKSGIDMPAEFIIPNCKPQSAMTFSMSGTGDPSTFTFTMDAFPGYTKYDPAKKVLAAIQVMGVEEESEEFQKADGYTQF